MRIKYLLTLFIVVGSCFIAFGAYSYMRSAELERIGHTVEGTVIRMDTKIGNNGRVYIPIVHYIDHKNEKRELVFNQGTNPPAYFKGEKVKVIYDPANPKYPVKAKIKDFWGLYGAAVFMAGFGSFFVLLSLLCWYIYGQGGIVYFGKDPSEGYEEV